LVLATGDEGDPSVLPKQKSQGRFLIPRQPRVSD
jgi:hypothetical protein